MVKNKFNWKVFFFSLLIVYFVAFVGSIFTSVNVNSAWYESIKPSITPPNWVFPIAWSILFFLIALAMYFSWINARKTGKRDIVLIFGINLLLNILWSVFYFGMKELKIAFFDLILLWISIWFMIFLTYKVDKKAAWLLVPYLLWVSFAGVLNYLSAF
jgi:tryptophan-rich sensory protein